MTEYLETTVDKFIFKVATDRSYTSQGLWVLVKNDIARLGVTDFFQQRNGDMAFVNLPPVGKEIAREDEIASVETIKVNLALSSPFKGQVAAINETAVKKPEIVNQDPYGEGWLCDLKVESLAQEIRSLLSPEQYFILMKKEAEEEVKKNE
jgi:glycine cleavage system H protein